MQRVLLLAVVLVAACYAPELRECSVVCDTSARCAPGQVCGKDGWCATEAMAGRCATQMHPDADSPFADASPDDAGFDANTPPPRDAPVVMVDAPPASTCNATACATAGGACLAGRCAIARTSPGSVTCPAGMPCTVTCTGVDACKQGVTCGGATSCIVRCDGKDTCKDRGVDCGSAATCEVTCRGDAACQHGHQAERSVECRASDCTVTCDGDAACQDGIDVDPGGTCTSSCCGSSACQGGTDTCANDNTCS